MRSIHLPRPAEVVDIVDLLAQGDAAFADWLRARAAEIEAVIVQAVGVQSRAGAFDFNEISWRRLYLDDADTRDCLAQLAEYDAVFAEILRLHDATPDIIEGYAA